MGSISPSGLRQLWAQDTEPGALVLSDDDIQGMLKMVCLMAVGGAFGWDTWPGVLPEG